MRLPRRLVAFALGSVAAVLLGEAALRWRYPLAPPSLSALAEASPDSVARRDARSLAACRTGRVEGGLHHTPGIEPRQQFLYVVGDSIAAGWGVRREESFAARLQSALRQRGGAEVTLVNDANPGASLCELAARVQLRFPAGAPRPDWAVLAVFVDDLDQHGAMYVGDRLVAWPESGLPASVAPLFRASWLLNLAWYAAVSRSPGQLDAGIPPDEHALFARSLREADARLNVDGTRRVWVLLPPAGQGECPADARRGSWCERFAAGAVGLRALFAAAGVPLVDLAGVYGSGTAHLLPGDVGLLVPDHVAVHPNAAGHALLADAILPLLTEPASPR